MEIEPHHVIDLMARFDSCNDGVIHSLSLLLVPSPDFAVVLIEAHDRESPSGWSRLRFTIEHVEKPRIEIGKTIFAVLCGGYRSYRLFCSPNGDLDERPSSLGAVLAHSFRGPVLSLAAGSSEREPRKYLTARTPGGWLP